MYQSWQGLASLTISRNKSVFFATLSFAVYFSSVVAGSILQKALGLNLQMGWGQQVISVLTVLLFASLFKKPKELLGLGLPMHNNWILITLLTAFLVIAISIMARMVGKEPAELGSVEYYLYEATMPGLGEELGLRGLVFGFLLYFAKKHAFTSKGIWTLIVLQALPFGFLHLFQTSGLEAILIFTYSSIAAIAFAWLRLKTGSIIPCIIAHNIVNAFGSFLYYLLMH